MTNPAVYRGYNANRLHSNGLWGAEGMSLITAIQSGERDGFYFFDDFPTGGSALSSTTASWVGGSPGIQYKAHITAGATCRPLRDPADDQIGVLSLDIDADNDEGYLTIDNTYGEAFGKISNAAGDNRPIIFEGRVRFANIASSSAMVAKMFGLRAAVDAATLDIPDGGASIKVEEFVGFRALSDDGDGMDAVYVDNAEVVYAEAASYSNLVILADTWYKFGLFFDGSYARYFVNGIEIGTGVLPAATNFPNAEPLVPFFGGRLDGSDAANHIDIDWWAFLRCDDLRM